MDFQSGSQKDVEWGMDDMKASVDGIDWVGWGKGRYCYFKHSMWEQKWKYSHVTKYWSWYT